MKSWFLKKPKQFALEEQESQPLSDKNVAKIKLEASIISSTDLRLYNGLIKNAAYPIIPGRHGAGVVSEIAEDNDCCLTKGDRVVVDSYLPCGNCFHCKTNRQHLCVNGKTLGINTNGLYTNFATLKCNMLHRIPDHMSNETALFTEYTATALSIIDKIDLQEGDHVAIFSASKLGFILAQLVTYYQGIAIMIDIVDDQLEKLKKEQIGFTVNPKAVNLTDAVKEITGGRKCEKVVYLSNSVTNMDDAIECCGFGGIICLAGLTPVPPSGDFSEILRKQLSIVSVTNGYKNFPSAINLLATKTIKIGSLVGEKIKFDAAPEAFEKLDYLDAHYCSAEIIID